MYKILFAVVNIRNYIELLLEIVTKYFSAKSIELRKSIEILSQTFERIVDRKDAILKSLVKDLEEAEEQYQMALRSHLQNLNKLVGKYQMALKSHLQDFNKLFGMHNMKIYGVVVEATL